MCSFLNQYSLQMENKIPGTSGQNTSQAVLYLNGNSISVYIYTATAAVYCQEWSPKDQPEPFTINVMRCLCFVQVCKMGQNKCVFPEGF